MLAFIPAPCPCVPARPRYMKPPYSPHSANDHDHVKALRHHVKALRHPAW